MRIILPHPPFADQDCRGLLWRRGWWPVKWLRLPESAPCVAAFRLPLHLDSAATIIFRITAGERYRLWVDGEELGVGPERGDLQHWRLDAWQCELVAGDHWLAVQVWALGQQAPAWQVPIPPGLLVIGEGDFVEQLSTSRAPWQCRVLPGHDFEAQARGFFTGPRVIIDGSQQPWGWQTGAGDFAPAQTGPAACSMAPGSGSEPPFLIPAQTPRPEGRPLANGRAVLLDAQGADGDTAAADPAGHLANEATAWQQMLDGQGCARIAAGQRRRCLIDLGTYVSAWPRLRASGAGGHIRLRLSEGLYDSDQVDPKARQGDKGDRSHWQGRYMRGVGPAFSLVASPQEYQPLEWECGRWLEISALAGDEDLIIHGLQLLDTSYPLSDDGQLSCDDPSVEALRQLCVHTLRVGTHDHYCDCPYYERLQYLGDTRLEILSTYCLSEDDHLPQRALEDFAGARLPNGMLPARHPAKGSQVIPPFALWWIGILFDRWLWRDDVSRVQGLLPTARGILDAWWSHRNADGLIEKLHGWNFVDWVTGHGWECGMPQGADQGVSSILNWQMVLALRQAADMEAHCGEGELAALHRRRAAAVAEALTPCFDQQRGRWRDAPGSAYASEHTQILALLAGDTGERAERTGRSLCQDHDLARTTIYFTHYLFEAYRLLGRGDLLWQRLGLWRELLERGLTTTPEQPEPTRSDCHPWGAHPLYHLAASIAGIRPTALGFSAAEVRPLIVPLQRLALRIPHPRGAISVDLRRHDGAWTGTVLAPKDLPLTLAEGLIRP